MITATTRDNLLLAVTDAIESAIDPRSPNPNICRFLGIPFKSNLITKTTSNNITIFGQTIVELPKVERGGVYSDREKKAREQQREKARRLVEDEEERVEEVARLTRGARKAPSEVTSPLNVHAAV